jgi:hypothetical protein
MATTNSRPSPVTAAISPAGSTDNAPPPAVQTTILRRATLLFLRTIRRSRRNVQAAVLSTNTTSHALTLPPRCGGSSASMRIDSQMQLGTARTAPAWAAATWRLLGLIAAACMRSHGRKDISTAAWEPACSNTNTSHVGSPRDSRPHSRYPAPVASMVAIRTAPEYFGIRHRLPEQMPWVPWSCAVAGPC